MTLRKTLSVFILTLAACSSGLQENTSKDTSHVAGQQDTSHYADLYPSVIQDLNKKHIAPNGSYCILTQFSDSTVKITWGNDSIKRVYNKPLDFMFTERLNVKWENKDYMILDYNTGSNAWLNVVFPLNSKELVQEFGNGLSFNEKGNYLVTEGVGDTVLAVHNLKTQQEQFIIEKQRPCESVTNYACIDTINIKDKVLYYKWVTPRTDITPNSKVERHRRLKI